MPNDLAAALGRLSQKIKSSHPKALLDRPVPPPAQPPQKLLLYVFKSICRHCGDTSEYCNDHLLGVFAPSISTEKYHAARYIGEIPEGTPCVLIRHKEPIYHDWCPKCFPSTAVEDGGA